MAGLERGCQEEYCKNNQFQDELHGGSQLGENWGYYGNQQHLQSD